MPDRPVRTSRPISALLLGLAATLLVAVAHLGDLGDQLELMTLDLRFRHLSTAPPNHDVVHVDIDDGSLTELGRWPWPRELQAAIAQTLLECGAKAVALDIVLPEPQELRYVSEGLRIHSSDTSELLGSGARIVFDDAEMTEALGNPNVFLAMHLEDLEHQAQSASDAARKLTEALLERPDLTLEEGARRAGLDEAQAAPLFVRARRQAIDRRIREILSRSPDAGFETVRRILLPDQRLDERTEERLVAERAYLRQRALLMLPGKFSIPSSQAAGYPARAGQMIPPVVTFAQAVEHSGFVHYRPDVGGIVRRIQLLARSGEHLYPQFALSLAAWSLGLDHGGQYTIEADASHVTIRCKDGTARKIPIDKDGCMLINWSAGGAEDRRFPRHIPASAVAAAWKLRAALRKNANLLRLAYLRAARRVFPVQIDPETGQVRQGHDLLRLFEQAQQLHEQIVGLRLKRQRALLYEPANVPPEPKELIAEEVRIESAIGPACEALAVELSDPENLAFYLGRPAPPATTMTGPAARQGWTDYQAAKQDYEKRAAEVRKDLAFAEDLRLRVRTEDARIRADIDRTLADLRKIVQGKVCLVGSTATGAADFVPTPVEERTPGVLVHGHIFNTIRSGAFIDRAPPTVDVLVILLAGAIVSLLAATRPVLQAAPLALLAAGAFAAFNALVVFHLWSVWLVMVAPLTAMLASFLVVTAYRQLTEERAKRHILGIWAHAVSAELVDALITDPSLARPGGERRVVSCYFSDLQGFTPLSERLGEQRTVKLLNHYFDHMTDVIKDRCGGYINKFMGDGLMVLFGAPVPYEDHASRALRAAAETQDSVAELNAELAEESETPPHLICRVGVATGEVIWGNCGSTEQADYTAIGDTVNLASRLESANKQFGTRILLAGESWDMAEDRAQYLARPLGEVLVVGKTEPVSVWNVLGRVDEADEAHRKACEDFARAIELYRRRKFAAAGELFDAALEAMPGDGAAQTYIALCRQYMSEPPGDEWTGALQLTEK